MPIDNKSDIGTENDLPTPAWDDIVQNSFEAGQAKIYEQASVLWDFYYQIYNGGIDGWISNRYFFRIHDVRSILHDIGGNATLEIKNSLTQVLPFLNFQFDPLMEPHNPNFYLQSCINKGNEIEWETLRKKFNEKVFALKQEFRRECEEYFSSVWHYFN